MLYPEEQARQFQEQKFEYLLIEEANNILTLTLNRPQKKNAMNPQFMNEIVYALSYAHFESSVWAVQIQANGDVFTAGADLKAFAGEQQDPGQSTIPEPPDKVKLGEAFNRLHKPSIAKVDGNVYAGGFLIICGCTHVIAAEEAKFSLPEVKRGIWPMQVMASMLQVMHSRQVLDFCMRGRTVKAQGALGLGLATEVAPKDQLDQSVVRLLDELRKNSPSAIRLGLRAFDELRHVQQDEQHAFLRKMLDEILQTEDAAEGIAAFREKRQPVWKGK